MFTSKEREKHLSGRKPIYECRTKFDNGNEGGELSQY